MPQNKHNKHNKILDMGPTSIRNNSRGPRCHKTQDEGLEIFDICTIFGSNVTITYLYTYINVCVSIYIYIYTKCAPKQNQRANSLKVQAQSTCKMRLRNLWRKGSCTQTISMKEWDSYCPPPKRTNGYKCRFYYTPSQKTINPLSFQGRIVYISCLSLVVVVVSRGVL